MELLVLVGVVNLHTWTNSREILSKAGQSAVSLTTTAVVLTMLVGRRPTLRQFGLAPSNWGAGVPLLVGATLLAATLILTAGFLLGCLGAARDVLYWIGQVWYLEGVQQVLLQVLLRPRLTLLAGGDGPWVSLQAAALFSLLHLPNPILTPFTLAAAYAWSEWFRRYENLPAVWLSHFLLGWTVLVSLDGDALRRLRVGAAYLYYKP